MRASCSGRNSPLPWLLLRMFGLLAPLLQRSYVHRTSAGHSAALAAATGCFASSAPFTRVRAFLARKHFFDHGDECPGGPKGTPPTGAREAVGGKTTCPATFCDGF